MRFSFLSPFSDLGSPLYGNICSHRSNFFPLNIPHPLSKELCTRSEANRKVQKMFSFKIGVKTRKVTYTLKIRFSFFYLFFFTFSQTSASTQQKQMSRTTTTRWLYLAATLTTFLGVTMAANVANPWNKKHYVKRNTRQQSPLVSTISLFIIFICYIVKLNLKLKT